MGQPFVGEIRMFGGYYAPANWHFCDGSLMQISENDVLFSLLGTTYGGDGESTFGLPDLRGRVPIHAGQGPTISQNYQLGELAGVESVTLTAQQMPIHNHAVMASTAIATDPNPASNILATSPTIDSYVIDVAGPSLASNTVQAAGGSQPHDNMMPFLCITFIISLYGIYPTQN
jgi:microcystin-dependent protein